MPQYTPPPSYDNKRQQDYVAEEAYWAQRIESLKRAHNKISSGMQTEYQKTLKEANELFASMQGDKQINKLTPCQEEKAKVIGLNRQLFIFTNSMANKYAFLIILIQTTLEN